MDLRFKIPFGGTLGNSYRRRSDSSVDKINKLYQIKSGLT
jgi:hypothetical protein